MCIKFGINNKRKGKHGALIDSEILSEVYLELAGGKQPGFQFSSIDIDNKDVYETAIEKEIFVRKKPLEGKRLSQKEIDLHREFISDIQNNFWT